MSCIRRSDISKLVGSPNMYVNRTDPHYSYPNWLLSIWTYHERRRVVSRTFRTMQLLDLLHTSTRGIPWLTSNCGSLRCSLGMHIAILQYPLHVRCYSHSNWRGQVSHLCDIPSPLGSRLPFVSGRLWHSSYDSDFDPYHVIQRVAIVEVKVILINIWQGNGTYV